MNTPQRNAELEALRAETAAVKERAAALEAQLRADELARAERAVQDAIQRGVIPSRHTKLREAWLTACLKDRNLIELLAMMPGSAALQSRRAPSVIHGKGIAPVQEPEQTPTPEDNPIPVYEFAQ